MMENYDKEFWENKKCPKYDCKKESCKCGLKKVYIPTALGDDSKDSSVAPKNGAYCNAIVVYEANDHVYIYSTEGIPTLINVEGGSSEEAIEELTKKLNKEILDRGAADDVLQQEINDLKNSPDVVDIVATYAALQAYDTSKLGDNDIIRVLADETHDGQSTYYRWSTTTSTWTYIGAVGDYYTKGQVDTLLGGKQDKLTAGANITIDANNEISATDTTYSNFTGATMQQAGTSGLVPAPTTSDPDKYLKGDGSWGTPTDTTYTAGTNVQISSGNVISATDTTYSNFTGTDGVDPGAAGLVPAPATTDAGKFLKADGTWDTVNAGPTVVQTTGTSTTDVMSQDATTGMVFRDKSTKKQVQIGDNSSATGTQATVVGSASTASGIAGVALGGSCQATAQNSVAFAQGQATVQGEFNVGTSYNWSNGGYNNTAYRLISGVYDGQSSHDAATLGQLDGRVKQNAGAPTTSTVGTVGQLLEDTTNGKLYQCTAVDTTDPNNPSYTWDEVGAGGGSGDTVYSTKTTSNLPDGGAVYIGNKNAQQQIQLDPTTTDHHWRYFWALPFDPSMDEGYTYVPGQESINIGGIQQYSDGSVTIGYRTKSINSSNVVLGYQARSQGYSSNVIIGDSTLTYNGATVAIGKAAQTGANGSVALGAYAKTTSVGEMNIGTTSSSYGYNSSNYRLLTGVYDGQNAHDAATVGQLNSRIIGSLTSAPTTSTIGSVGSLLATVENGTGHLYICTDDTGGVYTWQTLV